jgi:hypothetical protein
VNIHLVAAMPRRISIVKSPLQHPPHRAGLPLAHDEFLSVA